MITSMLQTYKYNQSRQTNSLRLYESGKIYRYKNKKIIEKNIISGIIGGVNFNDNIKEFHKN